MLIKIMILKYSLALSIPPSPAAHLGLIAGDLDLCSSLFSCVLLLAKSTFQHSVARWNAAWL